MFKIQIEKAWNFGFVQGLVFANIIEKAIENINEI